MTKSNDVEYPPGIVIPSGCTVSFSFGVARSSALLSCCTSIPGPLLSGESAGSSDRFSFMRFVRYGRRLSVEYSKDMETAAYPFPQPHGQVLSLALCRKAATAAHLPQCHQAFPDQSIWGLDPAQGGRARAEDLRLLRRRFWFSGFCMRIEILRAGVELSTGRLWEVFTVPLRHGFICYLPDINTKGLHAYPSFQVSHKHANGPRTSKVTISTKMI